MKERGKEEEKKERKEKGKKKEREGRRAKDAGPGESQPCHMARARVRRRID